MEEITIRESIIKKLDHPFEPGDFSKLLSCLHHKEDSASQLDIELYFKGVIESLYYRPNNYVLVLESDGAIGKTEFFYRLLPDKSMIAELFSSSLLVPFIYEKLIINFEFIKRNLGISANENWTTTHGEYPCDKRLASYFTTTNYWNFPKRKNFIVCRLESIDKELFNSIYKLNLWREIFNKFKPEGK